MDDEKTQTAIFQYNTTGFKINTNFFVGSVILFPKHSFLWRVWMPRVHRHGIRMNGCAYLLLSCFDPALAHSMPRYGARSLIPVAVPGGSPESSICASLYLKSLCLSSSCLLCRNNVFAKCPHAHTRARVTHGLGFWKSECADVLLFFVPVVPDQTFAQTVLTPIHPRTLMGAHGRSSRGKGSLPSRLGRSIW